MCVLGSGGNRTVCLSHSITNKPCKGLQQQLAPSFPRPGRLIYQAEEHVKQQVTNYCHQSHEMCVLKRQGPGAAQVRRVQEGELHRMVQGTENPARAATKLALYPPAEPH